LKENKYINDKPLYKDRNKQSRIDKDTRKVITEKRGIFAGTLKQGYSTTPGILFAEFREDPRELKNLARELKKQRPQSLVNKHEKGESSAPFKPASLINKPFQTDKQLYGEDPTAIRDLLKTSISV
jgi:hypothetical protein